MEHNKFKLIQSSFWFIPTFYGLGAFIAAILTLLFDQYIIRGNAIILPYFFFASYDTSVTILSTLVSSMLTMTTITFSTIMVVLTTYLSNFSPRTLQNFITDRITKRVLGIFVGGVIYFIILLLLIEQSNQDTVYIAPVFAVLYAIICVAYFVFFIHHVSNWILVGNLIQHITSNTLKTIDRAFLDFEEANEGDIASWDSWELDEIKMKSATTIRSSKSGYLQNVDIPNLIKLATNQDFIIRLEKDIGEFVDEGTVIFSYWSTSAVPDSSKLLNTLSLGTERTTDQDIEYGIQKLVEIALRAISPGINDPNTAINCINRLGKVLSRLGQKHIPQPIYHDTKKNLRVITEPVTYSKYLYKSFYQIRHYAREDVSVLASILQSLEIAADGNKHDIHETIWEFGQFVIRGFDPKVLDEFDHRYINEKLENLAKATGFQDAYQPLSRE
ncbi:DUF2254 domain-containing protein [Guptibacillus hwajinpoensis]|uniref:DUF2254 domain-containing protein n=1 Tax=Guptibacillus hwajinpoensis TaxID=208199 RepID=A0A0J6CIY8_9BACL|nr:DUF2254 domain-containing protein [Alkalihalobacillus macyae]KMM36171.1 hypothetical protein AB986_18785 [Alkalihalobacillus macyae]